MSINITLTIVFAQQEIIRLSSSIYDIERVFATTVVSPYKSPDIVVLTMLIFLFEKFPNLVVYEYSNGL